MKLQTFSALILSILLTAVAPVSAQSSIDDVGTSSLTLDEAPAARLSDMPMHLNAQLGASERAQLSGALTTEFGLGARRLETGLLVFGTDQNSIRTSALAAPMMAKLRVVTTSDQSWFIKVGGMPSIELNSSRNSATRNLNVFATIGVGGRLKLTRGADLVVDATYNHGLLDSLRTMPGMNHADVVLVLAGISFRI